MFCLKPFLMCCPFISRAKNDLDLNELPDELANNYEDFFKTKHKPKRRFENYDICTKNEAVLMDRNELSPNCDHILEVIVDQLLQDIVF